MSINILLNNWKPIVEILILWFVFYKIMLFFEGTRALQVLRGIIVLVFSFFIFQLLRLETLDWLLTHLFGISVIAILIIFQTEIREGLARLGRQNIFKTALYEEEINEMLEKVVKATDELSKKRMGALIALEKEDSLKAYVESGIKIDSIVTLELIQTIFTHNSLLHDGGIIIRHGRIVAAGCLFPLTEKGDLDRVFGMRHRAAIGLVEQTDSIVVVVSEESGDVSLCYDGRLRRDLDSKTLLDELKNTLSKQA